MAKLDNKNQITVRTYTKEKECLPFSGIIPNIVVTEIDGDNVTCTIGGSTSQTISKDEAFAIINYGCGYID